MNKHTPGPWRWERDANCEPKYGCLRAEQGPAVIDLACNECGGGQVKNEADRALLAAAPELLAALEALMKNHFLICLVHGVYQEDNINDMLVRVDALAAIAKATGQ